MQRDRLLIAEMIDAANRIVELVSEVRVEDLDSDRSRRESLLWNFTVLGEASSQVSDETKSDHPEVQWQSATAMRNRIVHGYWSVSTRILLSAAQDDIPDLLDAVRAVEGDIAADGS